MALKYSDNYSLLETTDMDHNNTHSVEVCVKALEDENGFDRVNVSQNEVILPQYY